jgi:hypothetical protein
MFFLYQSSLVCHARDEHGSGLCGPKAEEIKEGETSLVLVKDAAYVFPMPNSIVSLKSWITRATKQAGGS